MKWKQPTRQHTRDDVKYPAVCAAQREYGSNMPSKSMPVDFLHTSLKMIIMFQRKKKSHSCIMLSIKDNIGLVCIDDQIGDDMISASLVIKLEFETQQDAMPNQIKWIHQEGSKRQEIERCTIKFPVGGM